MSLETMIPKSTTLLRWHRNWTLAKIVGRFFLMFVVLGAPLFALALATNSIILLEMALIIMVLIGGTTALYVLGVTGAYRLIGIK